MLSFIAQYYAIYLDFVGFRFRFGSESDCDAIYGMWECMNVKTLDQSAMQNY
jgi:hypothetical protein